MLDTGPPTCSCLPVGKLEIAERLSVTPAAVDKWRSRHDDFPAPKWSVSGNPCWEWEDVWQWHCARKGIDPHPESTLKAPVPEGLAKRVAQKAVPAERPPAAVPRQVVPRADEVASVVEADPDPNPQLVVEAEPSAMSLPAVEVQPEPRPHVESPKARERRLRAERAGKAAPAAVQAAAAAVEGKASRATCPHPRAQREVFSYGSRCKACGARV